MGKLGTEVLNIQHPSLYPDGDQVQQLQAVFPVAMLRWQCNGICTNQQAVGVCKIGSCHLAFSPLAFSISAFVHVFVHFALAIVLAFGSWRVKKWQLPFSTFAVGVS